MRNDLPIAREIEATRPLAARPHTCTICGLPIAIGTRYAKHVLYLPEALDKKRRLMAVRYHLPQCEAKP